MLAIILLRIIATTLIKMERFFKIIGCFLGSEKGWRQRERHWCERVSSISCLKSSPWRIWTGDLTVQCCSTSWTTPARARARVFNCLHGSQFYVASQKLISVTLIFISYCHSTIQYTLLSTCWVPRIIIVTKIKRKKTQSLSCTWCIVLKNYTL